MSLRLRLTLLYTSLVGGVLLLSGVAVYALVSALLIARIDTLLADTANQILPSIRSSAGLICLSSCPTGDQAENVLIQLWGPEGRLLANNTRFSDSIDPGGQRYNRTVFRNTSFHQTHLRV